MRTQTFHDFEAYGEAIRDADVSLMLSRRGRPFWRVGRVALGGLGVQYGSGGGGIICAGASRPDGCLLFLPLRDPETLTWNGQRFDGRSLVVALPEAEFCVAATRDHEWCTVFVPGDLVAGW